MYRPMRWIPNEKKTLTAIVSEVLEGRTTVPSPAVLAKLLRRKLVQKFPMVGNLFTLEEMEEVLKPILANMPED